jgi:hypothetical protein
MDYLRDECADGRRLGFTGKVFYLYTSELGHHNTTIPLQQAIHPSQIGVIQRTYVPTERGMTLNLVDVWENELTSWEKYYVPQRL